MQPGACRMYAVLVWTAAVCILRAAEGNGAPLPIRLRRAITESPNVRFHEDHSAALLNVARLSETQRSARLRAPAAKTAAAALVDAVAADAVVDVAVSGKQREETLVRRQAEPDASPTSPTPSTATYTSTTRTTATIAAATAKKSQDQPEVYPLSSDKNAKKDKNNTGLTVGIAVGSIVSLVGIAVAVVFVRKRPSNLEPPGGAAVPKTGARGRNSLRNKREPSQRSNTRPSSVRRSSTRSSASTRRAAAKGKKPSPTSKRESARGKGRRSSISSSTPSAARTSTKSKRRSNSMHVSNPAFALDTTRALPPIPRKINPGGDDADAYNHDGDQQRELDDPNDAYGTVKAFALGGAVRAVAHVKEDISGTPLYQNTAGANESPQLDADLYQNTTEALGANNLVGNADHGDLYVNNAAALLAEAASDAVWSPASAEPGTCDVIYDANGGVDVDASINPCVRKPEVYAVPIKHRGPRMSSHTTFTSDEDSDFEC